MGNQSFWQVLLTVLLAFIGGGIVNLIFESIRSKKKKNTLKKLLLSEIKLNKMILSASELEKGPWRTHKIYTSIYDNHLFSLTDIDYDDDKLDKIVKYYNLLDLLKDRDKENIKIDNMLSHGNYDGASSFQNELGIVKYNLRKELIELSNDIIRKDL